MLRQELSDDIVEADKERYRLDWVGKKEAILAANMPIKKTLRPSRDQSINFDSTQNLFIEGDNLEVLKTLQESYLNKVDVIYIDPPYNTGRNIIYKNDYSISEKDYLLKSQDIDEEGNIYIIYDYLRFKEKQLLLAKITEEDILNGQIKTMGSYLRRIVDQAG